LGLVARESTQAVQRSGGGILGKKTNLQSQQETGGILDLQTATSLEIATCTPWELTMDVTHPHEHSGRLSESRSTRLHSGVSRLARAKAGGRLWYSYPAMELFLDTAR
jgi:hypothetical protein